MPNIDLTNVMLLKTRVIHKEKVCVFTHLSCIRSFDTNEYLWQACLTAVNGDDMTGITNWDILQDEVYPLSNSQRFITDEN